MCVYADHSMVDTIIRNLIANALKFTPAGGQINVCVEEHEDDIVVSIADTGIGIAEEHVSKLFRIDAKHTTFGTEGEQGTGLGLSLCQELVTRNGGRIWVESVVDAGSTFYFTLPRGSTKRET
jgi:signal transduction histidine kinase